MKASILFDVLIHAALFLTITAIMIPLLRKYKIPATLGYLLAGILLGPQGLGRYIEILPWLQYITLQKNEHIEILSELGIVFLLFVIGLELTPYKLWQMRKMVFGLGSTQVLVSSIMIGLIAFTWGNSVPASILLGLSLSLSSTAMITQWLHERKILHSETGQTSLSILLLQDLAVIPILLLITIFTADISGTKLGYIAILLAKIATALLAIIFSGKWLLRPLFSFSSKHGGAEAFIASSLLVIAISASIAGMAGLSLSLGAFIGGLLLAETPHSYEIAALITPFKTMLLGIFFLAFGMSIDVQYILYKPFWLITSVFGLIGLKAIIIYVLCRIWNISRPGSAETALLLPQSGEFALLVTGTALASGLLNHDVAQFMFLTVGLTMLCTPVLAIMAASVANYLYVPDKKTSFLLDTDTTLSGHVVIFGYGRMGAMITEILASQGIKTIVFEKAADRLNKAQKHNIQVYYGDAAQKSTLDHAQIAQANAVVVTIDDASVIKNILQNIRAVSSRVAVIIRIHKDEALSDFADAPNTYLVPEYLSTSLILAQKVLEQSGYNTEEAKAIVQQNY